MVTDQTNTTMKKKTFKDLKFGSHPTGVGRMARLCFDNGYGISVVRFSTFGGYGSYTDNDKEWEVAVLKGHRDDSCLTYETPITDDVIGHLKARGVTDVMRRIQALEPIQS